MLRTGLLVDPTCELHRQLPLLAVKRLGHVDVAHIPALRERAAVARQLLVLAPSLVAVSGPGHLCLPHLLAIDVHAVFLVVAGGDAPAAPREGALRRTAGDGELTLHVLSLVSPRAVQPDAGMLSGLAVAPSAGPQSILFVAF